MTDQDAGRQPDPTPGEVDDQWLPTQVRRAASPEPDQRASHPQAGQSASDDTSAAQPSPSEPTLVRPTALPNVGGPEAADSAAPPVAPPTQHPNPTQQFDSAQQFESALQFESGQQFNPGQPSPAQSWDVQSVPGEHSPSRGLHAGTDQPAHQPPSHPATAATASPAPWAGRPPRADDSDGGIATLPPMDVLEASIPLSEATGQPRRDPVMLVGMGLLYASAAAGALSYAKFWWVAIHVKNWLGSSKLIAATHPDPWSLAAVLWTTLITVVALLFVSATAVAGFQAWNGYRWSRIVAAVAAGLTLAAPLMINDLGWLALGLAAAGAGVLWLPQVSRYFRHWTAFRTPPAKQPVWYENVSYGPEARFR